MNSIENVRTQSWIPRRSRQVLAAFLTCSAMVVGGQAVAQADDPTVAQSGVPSGNTVHFRGVPQVGALFASADYTGPTATHFCTGSVIDSPHGNIVLTAAHCVYGMTADGSLTYAPGYDNTPNAKLGGVWTVKQINIPSGYLANQNPLDDYALLIIAPKDGAEIQQVTGALWLSPTHVPVEVTVPAYNNLDSDPDGNEPIECHALAFEETEDGSPWSRFNCPNYQDGVSGGPWITDAGGVIGITGGYEQGGDTPDWSYSTVFNAATFEFYLSVVAKDL